MTEPQCIVIEVMEQDGGLTAQIDYTEPLSEEVIAVAYASLRELARGLLDDQSATVEIRQ